MLEQEEEHSNLVNVRTINAKLSAYLGIIKLKDMYEPESAIATS